MRCYTAYDTYTQTVHAVDYSFSLKFGESSYSEQEVSITLICATANTHC